jgi:hypothetical protein
VAGLTESQARLLRFWGANMTFAYATADWWPGFSYTPEERARLNALAETVQRSTVLVWIYALVPAIFILIAAAAVAAIMVPALTWLYPNPADLKPLPFVLVLASVAAVSLGLGVPAAMALGGRIALWWTGDTAVLVEEPGDVALYAKFRRQLWRVVLVMCGLFVPGCWLWIIFDLHAGPFITAMKWAIVLWMGVSGVATWRLRG